MMPQADLLQFMYEQCCELPSFSCHLGTPVQGLIEEAGVVKGINYKVDDIETSLGAELVIAADGRFSRLRKLSGLTAVSTAPPMDVVWSRLPREAEDAHQSAGFYVDQGRMLILIGRPGMWQLGYVFAKGNFSEVKEAGLEFFRNSIGELAPFISDRVGHIKSWDQVHLLNIKSDRLEQWCKPGLLLIGDAAHVMSPVGGVGINCAIADAVSAANILSTPLQTGHVTTDTLKEVQLERQKPTKIVQRFQGVIQKRLVALAIQNKPFKLPLIARCILKIPGLRNLPARMFAIGPMPKRLNVKLD